MERPPAHYYGDKSCKDNLDGFSLTSLLSSSSAKQVPIPILLLKMEGVSTSEEGVHCDGVQDYNQK